MKTRLLNMLACPRCLGALTTELAFAEELQEGELRCAACDRRYPVENGIPRFVPRANYADSFGLQWHQFDKTQLDSHSGLDISQSRLEISTGWRWEAMRGKRVLDVGCGAGRFAEIAAQAGAHVVAVDYSGAVDVAKRNLTLYDNVDAVQASVYELPFPPNSFDYVYCLGVLQHTPNPEGAFQALVPQVTPGGRLAVDVYPRMFRNVMWPKYWLRPLTKRMSDRVLLDLVARFAPTLLSMSRVVARIPRVGPFLRYLIPVANYEGTYALTPSQLREWAVLDTFDMLAPEHDHPQSERTLRRWFSRDELVDVEVFRHGHIIGRASKRVRNSQSSFE